MGGVPRVHDRRGHYCTVGVDFAGFTTGVHLDVLGSMELDELSLKPNK